MNDTPKAISLHDIARSMGLSVQELLNAAPSAPRKYREFQELKKNGGYRTIEAPHSDLKQLQRLLLKKFLSQFDPHPILFGGRSSSTKKAVAAHVRKPVVIALDIEDFFPSVKAWMVRRRFVHLGIAADAASLLTRLVTYKHHLPQGAPTSPCLARLVLEDLASELNSLLKRIHSRASASIYVDDVTISGPSGIRRILPTATKLITRHGFSLKSQKTRVMPRTEEQESLGIRLNDGIAPTARMLRDIQDLARKVSFDDPQLRGKLAYVNYLSRNHVVGG
jgi:retron-type reverse transcriptase